MYGVTRLKFFKKSGARIYIPQKLISHPDFPFDNDDLIKIEFGKNDIILSKPEWWEMLDWNKMKNTYELLPLELKIKVDEFLQKEDVKDE